MIMLKEDIFIYNKNSINIIYNYLDYNLYF